MDILQKLASEAPDLSEQYAALDDCYTKKWILRIFSCILLIIYLRLWHQLTLNLDAFLSNPINRRGSNFKEVINYLETVNRLDCSLCLALL